MTFNEFFEGAEKRLSIVTTYELGIISEDEWIDSLTKTECGVLSIINNEYYKFFLLSESSFIVGKNFMMIKTCGKTRPLLILNNLKGVLYNSLVYSHYEFMKPELQSEPYSDINSELSYLQKITGSGSDMAQFNKLGKWYCYNHYDKSEDKTSDFFSNNFYEFISKQFEWKSQDGLLNIVLDTFPDAILSDKCFDPCGYSLNLLQGKTYLTVHVTPQNSCSYISVESNFIRSVELFKKIALELKSIVYEIHSFVGNVLNYTDSAC